MKLEVANEQLPVYLTSNNPREVEQDLQFRFLNLSNMESLKTSWEESIKNEENSHFQFLIVTASIFNRLFQMFPDTALNLITSTFSKFDNEDLLPFYKHLMSRQTKPFQISTITNSKFSNLNDFELNSVKFIRLNIVKRDICKSLKKIFSNFFDQVQYSNFLRLNPKYPDPMNQKDYKDVYQTIPQQALFDRNQANAFYIQEQTQLTTIPDKEQFLSNGFLYTIPIFATNLFRGFTKPDVIMEEQPFYICAAQYGCCFVGVGEVETRTIVNNQVKVEKESGYTSRALSKLSTQTSQERTYRITQEVNVKGFLNNSNREENLSPSIKVAVKYNVLNTGTTNPNFKSYITNYKSCQKVHFSQIERSSKITKFDSKFSLDDSLSRDTLDASLFLEEFVKKSPKSIDLDASLFIQSLTATDDISIYLDWKAIVGSAENISILALLYYIQSQVYTTLTSSVNESLEMLKTGPQLSLRKALLATFPSGFVNGVDITNYGIKRP